jgi:hypothetical protein
VAAGPDRERPGQRAVSLPGVGADQDGPPQGVTYAARLKTEPCNVAIGCKPLRAHQFQRLKAQGSRLRLQFRAHRSGPAKQECKPHQADAPAQCDPGNGREQPGRGPIPQQIPP